MTPEANHALIRVANAERELERFETQCDLADEWDVRRHRKLKEDLARAEADLHYARAQEAL